MTVSQFMQRHNALPEQIPGAQCLEALQAQMTEGLAGRGRIPMLLSYLPPRITPKAGERCWVLDAGGTNLRTAQAVFDEAGCYRIEKLQAGPMPGTRGALTAEQLYTQLAQDLSRLEKAERIGFCFSYNVEMGRDLDGKLLAWCKEVQVPDAVGKPVGASLAEGLPDPKRIHVLNDSVAAMLGATQGGREIRLGVILGTGVNVCYAEPCAHIPKLPQMLQGSMIISTEVGEFDGIPKSDFDRALIASTADPELAHGEKQCSGGYLGDLIALAWQAAAREGLLPEAFAEKKLPLSQISNALADSGEDLPAEALEIARYTVARAAKIAAILCAGPILRSIRDTGPVNIAMEGSQYWKLTGFREHFCRELTALVPEIPYEILKTENACLIGAALAAFAEPMAEARLPGNGGSPD